LPAVSAPIVLRNPVSGNEVRLEGRVVLAPIAGATTMAFRLIAKRMGASLVHTEMVSARGLFRKDWHSRQLAETCERERPVAVQLFGAEPEVMAEAAKVAVEMGADVVNVNAGCPRRNVTRHDAGAMLMKQPERTAAIIRAMVEAVPVPVTLKMRTGYSDRDVEEGKALEVAKLAEQAGAAAIALHARSAAQRYSGEADWGRIRELAEALDVPVIGNGDVWTGTDAARMAGETGCSGVMLARGTLGNPWLIGEAVAALEGGDVPPAPTLEERFGLLLEHGRQLIEHRGEHAGSRQMRSWVPWYCKGLPKRSMPYDAVREMENYVDLERVVALLTERFVGSP